MSEPIDSISAACDVLRGCESLISEDVCKALRTDMTAAQLEPFIRKLRDAAKVNDCDGFPGFATSLREAAALLCNAYDDSAESLLCNACEALAEISDLPQVTVWIGWLNEPGVSIDTILTVRTYVLEHAQDAEGNYESGSADKWYRISSLLFEAAAYREESATDAVFECRKALKAILPTLPDHGGLLAPIIHNATIGAINLLKTNMSVEEVEICVENIAVATVYAAEAGLHDLADALRRARHIIQEG